MSDSRKNKRKILLNSAAVLAAAIVLNAVFAGLSFLRLDASRGGIYSLSEVSKSLLKEIPEPLYIDLYYSKVLPPEVRGVKKYAVDFLKDYGNYSGDLVKISFMEIEEDNDREKALGRQIAPVRFDIIRKERYEQMEGFLGVSFQYLNKTDTIPFLNNIDDFEYQVTSKIQSLLRDEKPGLTFITDYGAFSSGIFHPRIMEEIRANYEISDKKFSELEVSTRAKTTYLFLGPEGNVSEKDGETLKKIPQTGNSLILALDAKKTNLRTFSARSNDTGLGDIFSPYGLTFLDTVVMDEQNQPIQVSSRRGFFTVTNIVRFPPFIMATDLSEKTPVFQNINSVVMPFASPVEISTSPKVDATPLIKTSRRSWARKPGGSGYLYINPFEPPEYSEGDLKGPFAVAVSAVGDFGGGKPGKLLLLGTSKFLDKNMGVPFSNYAFFFNAVDWMSEDINLISIRSKSVRFSPLREITPGMKTFVKYANMLLPPLAVALAGIIIWRLDKRKRRKFAEIFNAREKR